MTDKTLDEIEELLIEATIPFVREVKLQLKADFDERKTARSLIGKIGARIMFGKEIADPILLK